MINYLMPKNKTPYPKILDEPAEGFDRYSSSRDVKNYLAMNRADPTYDPYYKYQAYSPTHEYADGFGYVHFEDQESMQEFIRRML